MDHFFYSNKGSSVRESGSHLAGFYRFLTGEVYSGDATSISMYVFSTTSVDSSSSAPLFDFITVRTFPACFQQYSSLCARFVPLK